MPLPPPPINLTLAHSPDPDDAFMWWPITGKAAAPARPTPARRPRETAPVAVAEHPGRPDSENSSGPRLDTTPFAFRAVPMDIETLNKHAIACAERDRHEAPGRAQTDRPPHTPFDITALSLHAYAHVADVYALTACGGSFGDGYGPRVIARHDSALRCDGCLRDKHPVIAVPGARTTAFLVLTLCLGGPFRFVEMPFDLISEAVEDGRVDAGLIIHEGQVTLADRPLRTLVDLGAWWKEHSGLPLPLGVNAVRRDLDARFGEGTLARVAALLRRSVEHALAHSEESLDYAMRFALSGADAAGVTRERIARFVGMYVNRLTADMGAQGRTSIRRLLDEGARVGLCPTLPSLDVL